MFFTLPRLTFLKWLSGIF